MNDPRCQKNLQRLMSVERVWRERETHHDGENHESCGENVEILNYDSNLENRFVQKIFWN